MTGQEDKDEVLRDYVAFFKGLLPQLLGFVCHDTQGRVFWSEAPAEGFPKFGEDYRKLLRSTVSGSPPPVAGSSLQVAPNQTAYVARLTGDEQRSLGAITLLVEHEAKPAPADAVLRTLGPAMRCLQRELTLRVRLLEGQKKLQVQAAEERLLHKLEQLLHERRPLTDSVLNILGLCREHLQVGGAWLVIPEKHVAVGDGDAPDALAAAESCAPLLAILQDPDYDAASVNQHDQDLWFGIHPWDPSLRGVLALRGWQKSPFSERRLARVMRYVGSHVDSLLNREFDAVTGLMAWPVFERELAVSVADDGAGRDAILIMDLDRLHVVNETLGRDAGDEVLADFAALLREVLPGHPVTRSTGDQFVALLRHSSLTDARSLGESICSRFRERTYARADQTHRLSVSIGAGMLGKSEDNRPELSAAQVALQAAKDRGRGRVEVYESGDVSIVRRFDDIQMVGYVRNAIESNRLVLVAQPLVALKSGRPHAYHEILVRLVDDAGEHISPGEFMSAAERYQLMEELDRWVVGTTLEALARLGPHVDARQARFAVNLSGQSLGSDEFMSFVQERIRESGVEPGLIAFEITESVAVAKMRQAQAFMHAIRGLGCHLSLDDFGTGLSSFGYLKLFPVDTLKIDGSFVRDLTTNVVSQSVVAAIAEVARVMQLETVAEYVQDEASLALLRKLNISYAQGFFVGNTGLLDDVIAAIHARLAPASSEADRSARVPG